MRVVLGALGVLAGLWGVWLILGSADLSDLVNLTIWLGGGIIAHDVGVAAVSLVLAAVGARFLPEASRKPAAAGLVVLGTITVVAIPFLGRFGARASNPTLLDRNYVGGYLAIAALVLI
ncbi:MAG: hypothetical protein ACR2FV_12995, partial [Ornithinimicrobium sp.]|uniref:hypothetical protein n=1 Tax=Ornithinimicrobium sp. TaxID=1977084 RepID=UPI003D9B4A97